ncbi:hypothetical protein Y032_0375g224 [Ancylostoma ceylanicum]|uniref:Uncharacterized protein n=1 Tax=Ancylostoma ceylanicum TaxID=53326 RepID=A0A016RTP7_9BILA|nr:hypothetical protein Y032_0375g224 [Ancylostoma ceylanicum]
MSSSVIIRWIHPLLSKQASEESRSTGRRISLGHVTNACRKTLHILLLGFMALCTLYAYNSTTYPLFTRKNFVDDECVCQYKNISYDFCYHLPQNRSIKGRRFNCEIASHLERLGLLTNRNTIDASEEVLPTPAFVTAMSENHYQEGLTLIANIRSHWPGQKITIYDLGLSAATLTALSVSIFSFGNPFLVLKSYWNTNLAPSLALSIVKGKSKRGIGNWLTLEALTENTCRTLRIEPLIATSALFCDRFIDICTWNLHIPDGDSLPKIDKTDFRTNGKKPERCTAGHNSESKGVGFMCVRRLDREI